MHNISQIPSIKKIIPFLFLIFCLVASAAHADVVHLLSGKIIEGEIVERDEDSIKIDSGMGFPATYYMDEIDTIDGIPVAPPDEKEESIPIENLAPEPTESPETIEQLVSDIKAIWETEEERDEKAPAVEEKKYVTADFWWNSVKFLSNKRKFFIKTFARCVQFFDP